MILVLIIKSGSFTRLFPTSACKFSRKSGTRRPIFWKVFFCFQFLTYFIDLFIVLKIVLQHFMSYLFILIIACWFWISRDCLYSFMYSFMKLRCVLRCSNSSSRFKKNIYLFRYIRTVEIMHQQISSKMTEVLIKSFVASARIFCD